MTHRQSLRFYAYLFAFMTLLATALWVYGEIHLVYATELISPKGAESSITPAVQAPKVELDNVQKLDLLIGSSVDEFFTDRSQRSEMRMIMHCLAHRENGHAANRNCGDSGLACGPFQFHPETWTRMRSRMVQGGVATEIGDRYDLKESTRTTVWAIKNGRGLEWGPILRDSKGSDFAACQKPSFYKEVK